MESYYQALIAALIKYSETFELSKSTAHLKEPVNEQSTSDRKIWQECIILVGKMHIQESGQWKDQ